MKQPLHVVRSVFSSAAGALVLGVALAACSGGGSTLPQAPQNTTPTVPDSTSNLVNASITAADTAAATTISNLRVHLDRIRAGGITPKTTSFPFDVTNHGGFHMPTATQHFIYLSNGAVTSPASVWGNPKTFMTDANASMSANTYVHILDQYVAAISNGRYPSWATDVAAHITLLQDPEGGVMLSESDLMGVLHASLVALGSIGINPGYTHEFHIFLPPGMDTCFDYTTQCYSPDNSPTFAFCAYHGSVTFSGTGAGSGHVVFSVEPYQGTGAQGICYGGTTTLVNATASTLSHEFFESVSDPDPGLGWYNGFTGMEIGDECVPSAVPNAALTLNTHSYIVQKEWSNTVHGCSP